MAAGLRLAQVDDRHDMDVIFALDVSTSCTGVSAVDPTIPPDVLRSNVLLLDRIEFKGCNTFWEKADRVKQQLETFHRDLFPHRVTRVVLEEPLLGFRPGMSSAQTISQLLRFNGVVSYLAREVFDCEPEYISANHARKACGVKLQRTKKAGMSQKEQVFKHMSATDLVGMKWPVKKNGCIVDWSRDATDAYVIARAAAVDGQPTTAPRVVKKSKTASKV